MMYIPLQGPSRQQHFPLPGPLQLTACCWHLPPFFHRSLDPHLEPPAQTVGRISATKFMSRKCLAPLSDYHYGARGPLDSYFSSSFRQASRPVMPVVRRTHCIHWALHVYRLHRKTSRKTGRAAGDADRFGGKY
jgi:hypothetical protein